VRAYLWAAGYMAACFEWRNARSNSHRTMWMLIWHCLLISTMTSF
jgi:hypothetical protein